MNRSLYLFSILLFIGIIAVHFTVYMAYAGEAKTVKGSKSNTDNRQVQPAPEPAEGTTVKSSKSNSSERQMQPIPEPVDATTVKGSKSNTDNRQVQPAPEPADGKTVKGSKSNASERQQSQDLSCGANGTSTCGGLCERRGDICIQDCADCPCACKAGF